MNIEEDLTSLKEIVAIRKERCHGFIESDSCLISTKRLETLLTAYEKEKETSHYIQSQLDIANAKLVEEKEKNKKADYFMISNLTSRIVLNLIEKQSKEIEELKKYKKYYEEMEEVNKKFIAVDKIKAKIEEVDYKMIAHQDVREAVKQVLQSLLEKE